MSNNPYSALGHPIRAALARVNVTDMRSLFLWYGLSGPEGITKLNMTTAHKHELQSWLNTHWKVSTSGMH